MLGPVLKERGLAVTRENLIDLALEMRRDCGRDVLTELICRRIERSGFWAISGVRYPEEVGYFKKAFGDAFRLVHVACCTKKRYARVRKRGTKGEGRMSLKKFMEIEGKETEKIMNETIGLADFSVSNDGTIRQFETAIDGLARKIGIPKR